MAIIRKKTRSTALATREQFEQAVDRMATLSVEIQREEADLKALHQALDDEHQPALKARKAEIDALIVSAEEFFFAHRDELVAKGSKTCETPLAFYGVRTGLPTVVKKVREAWKSIAARWADSDALRRFTRATPDIDKEAILSVWRDNDAADKALLEAQGVSVKQTEEFWVKPRAEEQV